MVTFRALDLECMNYRLTEVYQRTSFLLEKVEEYDQQLASQLKDAIWTQVLQAFAQRMGRCWSSDSRSKCRCSRYGYRLQEPKQEWCLSVQTAIGVQPVTVGQEWSDQSPRDPGSVLFAGYIVLC